MKRKPPKKPKAKSCRAKRRRSFEYEALLRLTNAVNEITAAHLDKGAPPAILSTRILAASNAARHALLRARRPHTEAELIEALEENARLRTESGRWARGIKALLGLEHWPEIPGDFKEGVMDLLRKRLVASPGNVEALLRGAAIGAVTCHPEAKAAKQDMKEFCQDIARRTLAGDFQCAAPGEKEKPTRLGHEAIHLWFELSYAQYLTIPRSVLQSMPDPWQRRFVECLEELDRTIDWRPKDGLQYRCTLHKPDHDYEEKARDKGDGFDNEKFWGPEHHDPLGNYDRGRRKVPHRQTTGVPHGAMD